MEPRNTNDGEGTCRCYGYYFYQNFCELPFSMTDSKYDSYKLSFKSKYQKAKYQNAIAKSICSVFHRSVQTCCSESHGFPPYFLLHGNDCPFYSTQHAL